MNKIFLTIILIITLNLVAICQTSNETQSDIWVGSWSCAPYAAGSKNTPPSPYLANNTLRQVVRVSIGGDTLRLKLTNKTCSTPVAMNAVNIAVSQGGSTVDAATITPLEFSGSSSITIDPFSSVVSDPIAFPLTPSMRVAITIYYGQAASSSDITSHVASRTDSYILRGDQSSSASFSGATVTAHWFHINTVDVIAPDTAGCVGVLGNSITDGYGLHGGLQNRWTDFLSQELLNDVRTQNIGVLNLGIGGSLIRSSGISRYKEDLLAQSGLRWIIIFYGTNDIYSNASATSIIDAYKTIINDAHAKNIKVYGATITPFKGSGHYSVVHEVVRKDVNAWIRTPGNFDACIDFDKAIRDPNDKEKLLEKYSNDWLHPNVDGYAFLGKSVDLDLFTEIEKNTLVEADAGSDQAAVDYDNDGVQSVRLDGSASYAFGDNIVSYKWSENGTQFATGETATVSLAVGIHIITLTVSDKNGTIDSDEVTITVTKDTGIWLEAECGTIGSLWNVETDTNASNETYLTIKQGYNSTSSAPTGTSGLLTYTFHVEESGPYTLYARVMCPNVEDDSFWIKMDKGTFGRWNQISAPSWKWMPYGTTFNLSAGSHTLTIGYREDGAKLDKLWITNNAADIADEGSPANNCVTSDLDVNDMNNIIIFPNPVYNQVNIQQISSPSIVSITNSFGQELYKENTLNSQLAINMANYTNGIYLIKVMNQEYAICKKIIKNEW